jgi:hypothetical protein
MKIGKAIRTVRKLAKSAVRETAAMSALATPAWSRTQKTALKSVKALLRAFEDDLSARSERTSLQHAAATIAGRRIEAPLEPARALEYVAELAMHCVAQKSGSVRRDEISAVSIVRALAADIRALQGPSGAEAGYRGLRIA